MTKNEALIAIKRRILEAGLTAEGSTPENFMPASVASDVAGAQAMTDLWNKVVEELYQEGLAHLANSERLHARTTERGRRVVEGLKETIFQVMPTLLAWSIEAAKGSLDLAKFHGEEADPEWSMGHRQSFESKFPDWKFRSEFDKDLMLNTASQTFRYTVLNFAQWTPPNPYPNEKG